MYVIFVVSVIPPTVGTVGSALKIGLKERTNRQRNHFTQGGVTSPNGFQVQRYYIFICLSSVQCEFIVIYSFY